MVYTLTMNSQKGFISIIALLGFVLFAGAITYYTVQRIPLRKSLPSQIPIPSPIPIPTSSKPNSLPYNQDGTCPLGYVDYGMPLECVTEEYMEYCKTNPCPICLAKNTLIDTPKGFKKVQDLQVGMEVWTTGKNGHRVLGIIEKTSKVPVPSNHQMVHLILDDGRDLFVSPGHKTIDGGTVGDFSVNEFYDGAYVISVDHTLYTDTATYDILPSGETGFYWANNISVGSTLGY